jgi:hypothetical protein
MVLVRHRLKSVNCFSGLFYEETESINTLEVFQLTWLYTKYYIKKSVNNYHEINDSYILM